MRDTFTKTKCPVCGEEVFAVTQWNGNKILVSKGDCFYKPLQKTGKYRFYRRSESGRGVGYNERGNLAPFMIGRKNDLKLGYLYHEDICPKK